MNQSCKEKCTGRHEQFVALAVAVLVVLMPQRFGSIADLPPRHIEAQSAQAASADIAALQPDAAESKPVAHDPARTVKKAAAAVKAVQKVIRGKASWYGPGFHGKKTASGETFDQEKLTAAHKTLPLGSFAKITNLQNGESVEVEITDRGPYVAERVIDLSYAAADRLGFIESGIAPVRIELLKGGTG